VNGFYQQPLSWARLSPVHTLLGILFLYLKPITHPARYTRLNHIFLLSLIKFRDYYKFWSSLYAVFCGLFFLLFVRPSFSCTTSKHIVRHLYSTVYWNQLHVHYIVYIKSFTDFHSDTFLISIDAIFPEDGKKVGFTKQSCTAYSVALILCAVHFM